MKALSLLLLSCLLLGACATASPSTAVPAATSKTNSPDFPSEPSKPSSPTASPSPELPTATTETYSAYFPTSGWKSAPPETQGMDPASLATLSQAITDKQINLHSLLIIRHGYIVFEQYYAGYNAEDLHSMWSVTKSFVSALMGIALDENKLEGIDLPVVNLFPELKIGEMDERKSAMTIEDLLTMRSGLNWDDDRDIGQGYTSANMVASYLSRPMATKPGETFLYCSGCSHILSAIVAKSVGKDTQEYAKEKLFDPIGIQNYSWERDPQGISIGGWGLNLTPREMAKFGFLYLHNGEWDGQRIISTDWVKQSTTPHVNGQTTHYGYQWWIYSSHSAYAALGHAGQMIWVSPELDMIVVTTAELPNHDLIFYLIDTYIAPAVKP